MAADFTRDSFQEQKRYVEVTFQRNKNILDSELNELQRNIRVFSAKGFRAIAGNNGGALGNGALVFGDGVTANQLQVTAGIYLFRGYAIELFSNVVISGLTTPGGARTDVVWMSITETTIPAATDPAIAVSALGETSQRQQLTVTFGVAEGAALPADSGGEPYAGGTRYVQLATVYRTGVAIVAPTTVVDRRPLIGGTTAAEDRNTFVSADYVYWDGTTLTFSNLLIVVPNPAGVPTVYSGTVALAPAAGDGIGWTGTSPNQFRRRPLVSAALSGTESSIVSAITTTPLSGITAPNDFTVLLGWRSGSNIILRSGIILGIGDATDSLGQQPRSKGLNLSTRRPQQQFMDFSSNTKMFVDHMGLESSSLIRWDEPWAEAIQVYATNGVIPSANRWYNSVVGTVTGVSFGTTGTPGSLGTVAIQPGTSNGNGEALSSNSAVNLQTALPNNYHSAVLQIPFRAAGALANCTVWIGFATTRTPWSSGSFSGFKYDTAASISGWQCLGLSLGVNTAIAPKTNVSNDLWQILRVEYHAVNSPLGDGATNGYLLFYIDGVLVAQNTGNMFNSYFINFGSFNTAGSANSGLYLGAMLFRATNALSYSV